MSCFLPSIHRSIHTPSQFLRTTTICPSKPSLTSYSPSPILPHLPPKALAEQPPNPSKMSPTARSAISADENDILLGELRFTPPEQLPNIIETNMKRFRKQGENSFWEFMEERIGEQDDIEEKETLVILRDAVRDLVERAGGFIEEKETLVILRWAVPRCWL